MQIKAFTTKEYCEKLEQKGLPSSIKTVIRRCENNQLPTDTQAKKVGRNWIIFVGF